MAVNRPRGRPPLSPEGTDTFSVEVPIEVGRKIRALAASEERSVANWIRRALVETVKQKEGGR